MPHATTDMPDSTIKPTSPPLRATRKSKHHASASSSRRDINLLSSRLEYYQSTLALSPLPTHLTTTLHTLTSKSSSSSSPSTPTQLLSLGLGSLLPAKTQHRRLKQLALFLATADILSALSGQATTLYAQDPDFTRADEDFLIGLGVRILRTTSYSSLGEAASLLASSAAAQKTMLYTPFLTIDAYERLFLGSEGARPKWVLGDDFDALVDKWPRYSPEREQVERVVRGGIGKGGFGWRAVGGGGFWEEGDGAFPMAVYWSGGAGGNGKSRVRHR